MESQGSSANEPGKAEAGTPRDYSENMYRFYLELADCSPATRRMIEECLPRHHANRIVDLAHGFELDMPIQSAPDLVRHLTAKRIGVYQLVRLARTEGQWRR